mmetsp:Transcript_38235/g.103569  ORF Transcript_38235/g.103569 Transcript_38235/m.103569 type:complete len:208 (+) Transcript_38235:1412-2035(+)
MGLPDVLDVVWPFPCRLHDGLEVHPVNVLCQVVRGLRSLLQPIPRDVASNKAGNLDLQHEALCRCLPEALATEAHDKVVDLLQVLVVEEASALGDRPPPAAQPLLCHFFLRPAQPLEDAHQPAIPQEAPSWYVVDRCGLRVRNAQHLDRVDDAVRWQGVVEGPLAVNSVCQQSLRLRQALVPQLDDAAINKDLQRVQLVDSVRLGKR